MLDPEIRPVATSEAGPVTRPYAFTFGADHTMHIALAETGNEAAGALGLSLGDRYVVVHAPSPEAARSKFMRLFGPAFCDQYDLTAEGVRMMLLRYHLNELELGL
jgi:hypothetical protein